VGEMADPITLAALSAFVLKNAPSWLKSLRSTILGKSQEVALDKGKEVTIAKSDHFMRRILQLDEKEQLRHLEQALKNATERGLATFDTLQERDLYKTILQTLSQTGPQGEALRQEVLHLLTLSETPDLVKLSDIYNQRQRFYNASHQDIDAAPYLNSFFTALVGELYADTYFRSQLSDVLQLRAANTMQQSLLDIVVVLKSIGEMLEESYSPEEFAQDVAKYTAHVERTTRNLKIVGVVPKDQNADPELSGIFVPLRIALHGQAMTTNKQPDTIVGTLEQYPYLVLLGGPGSGKSTATKYLAWSHTAYHQTANNRPQTTLLSGAPLPLRIELRRLNEERKRANYDILSFVTEVLLKREGIEINPQMFKELLTRRCMLLLFDGLDEVATLNERLELVGEIEHFAISYPGNRVLVTSRRVGYDLTPVSHPLFTQAMVQNFNDEQIQQFLTNWYTAVLRLSPIPQRDQEELDLLLTTLQENARLHRLAENPLLLTVITVLHRYERLPDKRVMVYDRCADLLLETWAKLRGTNKRWEDMKMVKDDQYACVAYLAFVLHERSQEEILDDSKKASNTTIDVNVRFLQKNVEDFLRKRKLIVGVAGQRSEAKRFIDLVREEAGLIVERGTDENGEALYSFVHLTFQEYFAAADIYERYQQKEDPKIISTFLIEHLHDPHWREVILLLLGKLKATPATNQLRQILQGKLKSRRSQYTNIMQQDLFFVCDCLIEEIKVENTLVDMVKSRLCKVVKDSPFPDQQKEALEYLGTLMQTRLYVGQGQEELFLLGTKDRSLSSEIQLDALKILYINSPGSSKQRQLAGQELITLFERPDFSIDLMEVLVLSFIYSKDLEIKWFATKLLITLFQRPDLSIKQAQQIVKVLDSEDSEIQQFVTIALSIRLKCPNLSIDQTWQAAELLYHSSPKASDAKSFAINILNRLSERTDLSVNQILQIALSLYAINYSDPEIRQCTTRTIITLLRHPDLSVEELWRMDAPFHIDYEENPEAKQFIHMLFSTLAERSDFPIDQIVLIASAFYGSHAEDNTADLEDQQFAMRIFSRLLERPNLSIDQTLLIASLLYSHHSDDSEADKFTMRIFSRLLERPNLSIDQTLLIVLLLYVHNLSGPGVQEETPEDRQFAVMILSTLLGRSDLSPDQTILINTWLLYYYSPQGSEDQQIAAMILSVWRNYMDEIQEYNEENQPFAEITVIPQLLRRLCLTIDQALRIVLGLNEINLEGSKVRELANAIITKILKHSGLSVEQTLLIMAWLLYENTKIELLTRMTLQSLLERSDLSVDQNIIVLRLNKAILEGQEAQKLASIIVTKLLGNPDLSIDQIWHTAILLYGCCLEGSEAWSFTTNLLTILVEHPGLSIDQAWQTVVSLNHSRERGAITHQFTNMLLLHILLTRPDLSLEQTWQIAVSLNKNSSEGSDVQLFATSVLLSLLSSADHLTQNQKDMYGRLSKNIPQFHKLQPIRYLYRSTHPSSE
jgi:hypothetical protein